jgi:hypothetical protein
VGEEGDDEGAPDHLPTVVADFDAVVGRAVVANGARDKREGGEAAFDAVADANGGDEGCAETKQGELRASSVPS